MKNNLKFNSAICTSRVQSERLLTLGLKKETTDMSWVLVDEDREGNEYSVEYLSIEKYQLLHPDWYTPAWSLNRLIEMMPEEICDGLLCIYKDAIRYEEMVMDRLESHVEFFGDNMYENAISCIEWLIKKGHFNKEYLA